MSGLKSCVILNFGCNNPWESHPNLDDKNLLFVTF